MLNRFKLMPRKRSATAPSYKVALNDSIGVIGDSMTYGNKTGQMYLYWLMLASSGRCRLKPTTGEGTAAAVGSDLAVSGESTTQIAARAANIAASGLDVAFCMGFENDGTGVSAATMQANWETVFTALGSAKRIYMIGTGETKTVFASATLQARNAAFNAWAATASATYPNVRFIPSATAWAGIVLHNGAGGAGADSYDGIHPNLQGAKKFASNLWDYIKDEFQDGTAFTASPYTTNLYEADLSGTSGTKSNATGDVATGLALTNTTGATVVASKGTLNGETSQALTISGTATANSNVRLREAHTMAITTADWFDGFGYIKVSAADGVSAPVGLKGIGFESAGGRSPFLSQYHNNATNGEWTTPFEGVFRVRPEYMTGAGSSINLDLSTQLAIGAVDVRIEVSKLRVYDGHTEGYD